MDREATKQMYNQVLQQIQAGDPMAAYSIFEQMPFPDQMAMYVMPGVGDAIAAVEAGVYNQRSKDNFAQGNVGSGLMDAGIGGLALASTIPLLGKAAEVGNMGLKGARSGFNTLRSMRGDGMSGGSRGGPPKNPTGFTQLYDKLDELVKEDAIDNFGGFKASNFPKEYMTAPMPRIVSTGNDKFKIKTDSFDAAGPDEFAVVNKHFEDAGVNRNSILRLDDEVGLPELGPSYGRSENLEDIFSINNADTGSMKTFEFELPDNRIINQKINTYTVGGRPVASSSTDGFVSYYLPPRSLDDPMKSGRASSKIMKLERELATENMSPRNRRNIEAELRRLKSGST